MGLDRPGAWLYRRHTLQWMNDAEVRAQLPLHFRTFAHYCRLQSRLPGPVLGGQTLLRVVQNMHRFHTRKPLRLVIDDRTIFLHPDDPRMLTVPQELAAMSASGSILDRHLNPGDTFIDIGSNHGAFSVAASGFIGPEGTIVAFEPQPALYPLVERSLRANGVENFWVFPDGCGEQFEEVKFFVPAISSGSAGLFREFSARDKHQKLTVRLVRFDDIIDNLKLTGDVLVKLDVEGNEPAVLRGARRFIQTQRPKILMEFNPSAMKAANTDPGELLALLQDLNCRGYRPLDDLDRFESLSNLDLGQYQDGLLYF